MFKDLKASYTLWKILNQNGIAVDNELKIQLSQVKRLVIIEDGWTDSMRRCYEGVWAAGMLPTRGPVNLCIGQIPVKQANAQTLARAIARRLDELSIPLDRKDHHMIAYFVGDSAQVNPAMVKVFNTLTSSASEFIPCAAHMLNNMMQAVWSAVRPRVRHLLAVIETVRNRGAFRQLAEEMQTASKILGEHKRVGVTTIATAISVRWYSLAKMLSSAIELRSVIDAYLELFGDGKLKMTLMETYDSQSEEMAEDLGASQVAEGAVVSEPSTLEEIIDDDEDPDRQLPSDGITPAAFVVDSSASEHSQGGIGIEDREWQTAMTAYGIFNTFRTVMKQLESDNYGTIADIWRGITAICRFARTEGVACPLFGWNNAMDVHSRWLKKCPQLPTKSQTDTLIRHLGYSGERVARLTVPLFRFAAVLRPSNLRRMPEKLVNQGEWDQVMDCAKAVFEATEFKSGLGNNESDRVADEVHTEWESRLFGMEEYEEASDLSEPEWTRYTGLRVLSQEDKDLHQWWKDHAREFPTFYLLAKLYLFIPATSAGPERMFSKSRRVLDRLRLRLTPKHAELLVFLRENIEIVEDLDRQLIEL
jgi:hypothetical protein